MVKYSTQEDLMYKAGEKSLEYITGDVVVFGAGRTVCQALKAFVDNGFHKDRLVVCGVIASKAYVVRFGNVLFQLFCHMHVLPSLGREKP